MRQKISRLKTYKHRPAHVEKDREGAAHIEYGSATEIQAEMWPGGGKVQTEMYGARLPNIRNLRVSGKYEEISEGRKLSYQIEDGPVISAGDGICLYSEEEPDYKVVAVYPYSFLTLEVEKL